MRCNRAMRGVHAWEDDDDYERRENGRLRPAHEESSFSRNDRCMLAFLLILAVLTVGKMAVRDLMSGPDLAACAHGNSDAMLSKHLHCVSQNGTRSFAAFLAMQGAKKEHVRSSRPTAPQHHRRLPTSHDSNHVACSHTMQRSGRGCEAAAETSLTPRTTAAIRRGRHRHSAAMRRKRRTCILTHGWLRDASVNDCCSAGPQGTNCVVAAGQAGRLL